jgi:hypothetical protein
LRRRGTRSRPLSWRVAMPSTPENSAHGNRSAASTSQTVFTMQTGRQPVMRSRDALSRSAGTYAQQDVDLDAFMDVCVYNNRISGTGPRETGLAISRAGLPCPPRVPTLPPGRYPGTSIREGGLRETPRSHPRVSFACRKRRRSRILSRPPLSSTPVNAVILADAAHWAPATNWNDGGYPRCADREGVRKPVPMTAYTTGNDRLLARNHPRRPWNPATPC